MDEKKLVIDIFRTKPADEFTKAIADPDGKLETGSAAADAAADDPEAETASADASAETPPEKPDGTPPDGANGQPGTPPDGNPPDGAPNGQPGSFGGGVTGSIGGRRRRRAVLY